MLLLLSVTVQVQAHTADAAQAVVMPQESVVILHGIARSHRHMAPLAHYLEAQGYRVFNMDYPSTTQPIEPLLALIISEVDRRVPQDQTVHFVGYSMGGILIRALMHSARPKNLGKVVQLAPPNQGSQVADFLRNNWFYKKIYGPAGQQLGMDQSAIVHLFGKVDYPLGILAGNRTIDLLSSWIIPGEDDGKVSIESTKLPGMADHMVVASSHFFFPSNTEVHKQVAYFLQYGYFDRVTKE